MVAAKGLGAKGLGKALGKGLDSLIPNNEVADDKTKKVVEDSAEILINVNEIEPNRDQPRKKFDEDALMELAESIKIHGVIDPLTLVKRDGYYMIVNGEKYLPVNTEGNSVFEIPVDSFDKPLDVIADTVAMSKPHEIEYTIHFE